MTARNGIAARITAFVAAHPGCTRAELLAGCGIADQRDAMPTYCAKSGMIHGAGPRGSQRYFPSSEMAQARHQAIVDAAAERRKRKKREGWLRDNARKAHIRQARRPQVVRGIRERNAARRRARALLPQDVVIPIGVKVVVAPPMPERWT